MAAITESVQNDWESREILEMVQLKVLDLVSFLNTFDQTVRYKLNTFHGKLTKLERSLELAEGSVATSKFAVKTQQGEMQRARAAMRQQEQAMEEEIGRTSHSHAHSQSREEFH